MSPLRCTCTTAAQSGSVPGRRCEAAWSGESTLGCAESRRRLDLKICLWRRLKAFLLVVFQAWLWSLVWPGRPVENGKSCRKQAETINIKHINSYFHSSNTLRANTAKFFRNEGNKQNQNKLIQQIRAWEQPETAIESGYVHKATGLELPSTGYPPGRTRDVYKVFKTSLL